MKDELVVITPNARVFDFDYYCDKCWGVTGLYEKRGEKDGNKRKN